MLKKKEDIWSRQNTTVRIQHEFVGIQMRATNVLIIPFSFYGSAATRCVELTSFAHDEEAPFRTLHGVWQ